MFRFAYRALFLALVSLGIGSAASAQTQIKPYFMVVVDDSGSMGSGTGSGLNSCGQSRTRMNDAKCVLQRVVNAFGDVEFGLTSFRNYGSPTTIHVPISPDNLDQMVSWVDFAGSPELSHSGGTPISAALNTVRSYYGQSGGPIQSDSARGCRPYFVILLHDGAPNNQTASYNAATALRSTAIAGGGVSGGGTEDIQTHVILFGGGGSTTTVANELASRGGTGAARLAANETELAIAFSNIIADSILTETCDGADNDCDSRIDEGFQLYCNRDAGHTTIDLCVNPGDDCDGRDDNCFMALADEGPRNACGTCGAAPTEVCDRIDNNCNGLIDEGDVCMGCVPTGAEVCDNRDNDCDGRTDESLTRSCGTDIGVCTAGLETCSAGSWGGCTATTGGAEVCNGIDDDCDGRIDGQSRSCGTDEGACRAGRQVCTGGAFGACLGAIGPGTEVCDGDDNDCDGRIDEADPMVGNACGSDAGECSAGTIACIGGVLTCDGAVGPTEEICNELDDDCDGVVDDGLGVGAPCGSAEGLCSPGFNVCRGGSIVCDGEVGPIDEVCNNLDDDCDGSIDESLPLGVPCGSDEGLCMEGTLQCVDGREVCTGEVPPAIEGCDCEDNDCDGEVDEAAMGALCPGDSACVSCQCALQCEVSEFGFTCPTGRTPQVEDGTCFCVREACEPVACAAQTIERGDEVLCSAEDDDPDCLCKNNECTFACEGVVCEDGTVCEPASGTCVEDSCRGLGCPSGELCDAVTGECEADPCADTECPDGQACRGGECIGSCADVECEDGELCRNGLCEADPCDGVVCNDDEVCDPADGGCAENQCAEVRCPMGSVCEPLTGECETDPCVGLTCPDEQVCRLGECIRVNTGTDAGTGIDAGVSDNTHVLATGGGGCACTTAGATSEEPPAGPVLFALALLGLLWHRRQRRIRVGRKAVLAASTMALAVTIGGCDVDPFCLDCDEPAITGDAGPGGNRDAGSRDGSTDDEDAGPEDAGVDAGCEAAEVCNDLDDDCDGNVDEGIDIQTDEENCGGCGQLCAPASAFGECVEGVCTLDRCDVGFVDLDGDDENGCEYRCLPTAEDDSLCDLRDNDCDGEVDEDFDFETDNDNCGSCGRTCRFANAAASCGAGACVLGDCTDGFFDIDGEAATGCEYECTPSADGMEVCNRRDDDCDGSVDEGNPGGGAACGSDVGACMRGTEQCMEGSIVCMGATEPSTESCNSTDDDCDGTVDEGFLSGDIRNCGACGNVCSYTNGFAACVASACELVACEDGFWNADGNEANGCEYACSFNGAEACNGIDDDCDGIIDEDLSAPSNICDPNGVCGSGTVRCAGADGWECQLPATHEETEVSCDGLDNDCDGQTDEAFVAAGLGNECSNGRGECRRSGVIACTADAMGVACNAAAEGAPGTEVCDGLDNDCDGLVDEPQGAPGTNPSYVVENMVRVTQGGSAFYMYQYEASRPDATAGSSGSSPARSCSRPSVMPWTQVTYPEARDACAAAGLRLCTEAEWERACESNSGSCAWGSQSCGSYNANQCNGNDYDADGGTAGDQDAVFSTGSFNQCYAAHGGGTSNRIYDLSGNVKEWTSHRAAGQNPLRGGSMNNTRGGMRCDFDFVVADDAFQIDNVGFRCCSNAAP